MDLGSRAGFRIDLRRPSGTLHAAPDRFSYPPAIGGDIVVPRGVEVDFEGSVGAGKIVFFDEARRGLDAAVKATRDGTDAIARLIVDARVSTGQIQVAESPKEVEVAP